MILDHGTRHCGDRRDENDRYGPALLFEFLVTGPQTTSFCFTGFEREETRNTVPHVAQLSIERLE